MEATCHGKLSYCSAAGALESAEGYASSEEDDASQEPMRHELPLIPSVGGEENKRLISSTTESCELSGIEVEKTSDKGTAANDLPSSTNLDIRPQEQTTVEKMGSQTLKVDDPKKALSIVLKEHSKAEHPSISEVVPSKGLFSEKVVGDVSRQSVNTYPSMGSNMEPLHKMLPSTTTSSPLRLSGPNARDDASKTSHKVADSDKNALRSTGNIQKHSADFKEKPSATFTPFGQTALSAQGNRTSLSAYPSSQGSSGSSFASGKAFQSESRKELNAPPSQSSLTHFVQNAPKQFGNVRYYTS